MAAPLAGRTLAPPSSELIVAEWRDCGESSAEQPIAPAHVHHGDDEGWYVLEGRLGVRLDDRAVEAGPGEAVIAPCGVVHTFWNGSNGVTRYLIFMTPNLQRLIDELHDTGFANVAETFRKHDSELLG